MEAQKVVVELRGSHFVAWSPDESGGPARSVLMVGKTAEEAEARLRDWLARQASS